MSSAELDNLARIGKLKREPPTELGSTGLLRSAAEGSKNAHRGITVDAKPVQDRLCRF